MDKSTPSSQTAAISTDSAPPPAAWKSPFPGELLIRALNATTVFLSAADDPKSLVLAAVWETLRLTDSAVILPEVRGDRHVGSLLAVPVRSGGQLLGAVVAIDRSPRHWTEEERHALEEAAALARDTLAERYESAGESEQAAGRPSHVAPTVSADTDRHREQGRAEAGTEDRSAVDVLQRTGEVLIGELDSQQIVRVLVDESTAVTHAQFGAFVPDFDENVLRYHARGQQPNHFFSARHNPLFRDLDDSCAYPSSLLEESRGIEHDTVCDPAVQSCFQVPVRARNGKILGRVLLGHGVAGQFTQRDERVVTALAAQAAIALASARIHREQLSERRHSERAVDRMSRIQAVTAALSEASTSSQILRVIIAHGVASFGASAGLVALKSGIDATVEIVESMGFADLSERRISLDERMPITDSIREGHPIWIQSREDWASRVTETSSPRLEVVATQVSWACLPIPSGDRIVGTIALRFSDLRRFNQTEQRFMLSLARLCGQALERAQLYESERRARRDAEEMQQRFALLAAVSSGLASMKELEQALGEVALLSIPLIADVCFIDLLKDVRLERVAFAEDRATGERTDWILPDDLVSEAMTEGRTLSRSADYFSACATPVAEWTRDVAKVVIVPLDAGGRRVGTLTFVAKPETSRIAAIALAEELGRRAAVAIDNAHLYERAEKLRREAESANSAKDAFLATLSHELRTPLNAILGWAELLRGDQLSVDRKTHALKTIERNAKQQAQLVEDILDISRIIAGRLRIHATSIQFEEVLRGAIESIRPSTDAKNINVSLSILSDLGALSGDPNRLAQVLWNLLSNAVKFTLPGGHIEVRALSDRDHVRLFVRDDGIGISADYLPKVFERFWQADGTITRTHGGLGIGLSIANHIVELHGGAIVASSEGQGKGATFAVEIPRRLAPEGDSQARALSSVTSPLEGVRVLLVDDDPDTRELLGFVLEKHGAVVCSSPSVANALRQLDEWNPHVLVSDIGMPDQDGYDLIRQVRARSGASIPAVALTAYAGAEDSRRAILAGYQLHVPKPIEPDRLVAVVAKLASWACVDPIKQ